MGYTTKFSGKFTLSKLPQGGTIIALIALSGQSGKRDGIDGAPDSYCQWELTKDGRGIEWDKGEKFYDYVEWLQFILDKYLAPEGIELSGDVEYQGEDVSDSGALRVVDGKVKQIKRQIVTEELSELIRFKEFALRDFSEADELKREWLQFNGK